LNYLTPTERQSFVVSVQPGQYAAGTTNGATFSRGRARVALCRVMTGVVPAGSTVDVKVQGKNTTSGAFEDIVGKSVTTIAFTQHTNANSSASKTQVGILPLAEMAYDDYRAVSVVVGASGAAVCVVFSGHDFPEYPIDSPDTNAFAAWLGVASRK
jgi:hypothetical protein